MKRILFLSVSFLALLSFACGPGEVTPYSPYNTPEDRAVMTEKYEGFLSLWPAPFRSETVFTSLGKTHVLVNGPEDGKPVILLHGAMANALMWKDVVRAVSETHRTIAIDIVGHFGLSVPSQTGIDEDDLVKWVDELLDHFAIDKVTIISTSFGGWLAMKYSIASNARIDRMVILAAAPMSPSFSLRFIFSAVKMRNDASEENVEAFMTHMHGPGVKPNHHMVRFISEALRRGRPVLPRPGGFGRNDFIGVKQPILVVAGEHDRLYAYEKVEKTSKKYFANVAVVEVKDAGHFVFAEKPDEVNRHITAFLNF